ncbi:ThiF family adenylyltransferase [Rhodoferax sp. 4810]|uniref:ThiF family adenylyltransferase n=1 Tax=Thiospirillum jenense TaxID=1653858 RepID=A0A839HE69_9GAMM|nr:ThiF family adenylyltransferase [Thiospirillum jenense]MBB1075407.1 ThiF family adenylyltransferase [Rhodoferax jenense]MBB1126784.1 ThiF family adenylyltransferase [Thiospirillum jenense]
MQSFNYSEAFNRNIGWVTETELYRLRQKRVAIIGMGGVGGVHLLTLTRLGIGKFHIADLDTFELANFNRQVGAMMSTLDQPKVEVLARMARDINPELDLQCFDRGINAENIDAFLSGVDLFVDGVDFFEPELRSLLFARCYELGIPAITAGPIGMGVPYLIFMPGQMSFEQYFQLQGRPLIQQYVNFLIGLTPKAWHRDYLVDPHRFDLGQKRGPSTPMACQLCSGVVGIEALKILLRRGEVYAAPYYHIFDAYQARYARGRLFWGNGGPLQTIKRQLVYRMVAQQLAKQSSPAAPLPAVINERGVLMQILDLARWAPSGDNTQPWRFEIINDRHFIVHGRDTRDTVVYDLQGRASQLALGGLLETLEIAASHYGYRCEITRRLDLPDITPTFDVQLQSITPQPHPLARFIRARCTQRRAMSRQPLTVQARQVLEHAVGEQYRVIWLEGTPQLRQIARLLFDNAELRLTLFEAYQVHKAVIEWNTQFSADRIPDQALGLDKATLRLMRWALHSWRQVQFLNKYLSGTLLPRLQMDVWPALNCAAHFVIVAKQPLLTVDDFIAGGRAMQRFWLTATQ